MTVFPEKVRIWLLNTIVQLVGLSFTGSLTLHFHQGKISRLEKKEFIEPV